MERLRSQEEFRFGGSRTLVCDRSNTKIDEHRAHDRYRQRGSEYIPLTSEWRMIAVTSPPSDTAFAAFAAIAAFAALPPPCRCPVAAFDAVVAFAAVAAVVQLGII